MNQVVTPEKPPARRAFTDLPGLRRVRFRADRALSVTVAGVLMASVTVVAAAPAHADETYPRQAGSTLTLSGHGFGHGHGMSQWGAQAAAKISKLSWQSIVAFYYPGTTVANLGNPTIRVKVAAVGTGPLTVVNAPGLTLAGQALPATSGTAAIIQYRVTSLPTAGTLGVDMLTAAGWTPYPSVAAPAVLSSPATFANSSAGTVTALLVSGLPRTYRGSLNAHWTTSTTLTAVSVLPMESYLRSVVPVEMPPSWDQNALGAQTVAARSYANYGRAHAPVGQTWDTCDNTACQSYAGVSAEAAGSDLAIAATAGQTLLSGGASTFTEFGAANGGYSAAGTQTYLVAQPDPYDGVITNTANSWTASVTLASIETMYPSIGAYTGLRIISRDTHGQWGGRILSMAIDGSAGSVTVTGKAFRTAFALKSEWFIPTDAAVPAPPPAPAAWAVTTYTPYKGVVLQQGSTGAAVVALQQGLKITADGTFGATTRTALVAFQTKQLIPATGVVDSVVWNRLETQDYPLIAYRGLTLQQGSYGSVVVILQRALRVTADGSFGPLTAAAVKKVQLSAALAQTGVVSGWTWVAIEKAMPR